MSIAQANLSRWVLLYTFSIGTNHFLHLHTDTHTYIYSVSQKNMSPNFCLYLCQILTDFKNSFTDTLSGKFATKVLLLILPHLNCVATLPCETLMFVKLTIAPVSSCAQWLFGHFRKFRPRSQQMIGTTLDCVRPVSLDTWRVEWCVCGWSSCMA